MFKGMAEAAEELGKLAQAFMSQGIDADIARAAAGSAGTDVTSLHYKPETAAANAYRVATELQAARDRGAHVNAEGLSFTEPLGNAYQQRPSAQRLPASMQVVSQGAPNVQQDKKIVESPWRVIPPRQLKSGQE
jgi:hypothetical protein